jgi:hypothetical protein
MKNTRKRTGKTILKLTRAQIETIEREWWQAEYYK